MAAERPSSSSNQPRGSPGLPPFHKVPKHDITQLVRRVQIRGARADDFAALAETLINRENTLVARIEAWKQKFDSQLRHQGLNEQAWVRLGPHFRQLEKEMDNLRMRMAGLVEETGATINRAIEAEARAMELSERNYQLLIEKEEVEQKYASLVVDHEEVINDKCRLEKELADVKSRFDYLDGRVKCLEIDLCVVHKPFMKTYSRRGALLVPPKVFRPGQQLLYEEDATDVGSSYPVPHNEERRFPDGVIPPMSISPVGSSSSSSSFDDEDSSGTDFCEFMSQWPAKGSFIN
ncbi:hypothetical protein COLO4_03645 [Corchorus olitorius]|uniref:Uncharacterized protein n=1 Tax=Corchorus olitorius TaxID=93759 RepID=A0A1R3KXL9_9ROSI|nr:hypothetical protein COLO4_03645 [Corchorus olitorius]